MLKNEMLQQLMIIVRYDSYLSFLQPDQDSSCVILVINWIEQSTIYINAASVNHLWKV